MPEPHICTLKKYRGKWCKCSDPDCGLVIHSSPKTPCEGIHCQPPGRGCDRKSQKKTPEEKAAYNEKRLRKHKESREILRNVVKLKTFAVAAIGHALKGFPTCTQQEIDRRLSICELCEHFHPPEDSRLGIGSCGECGCNIRNRAKKFLSKIAWADQRCPLKPPKWDRIDPS